MDLISKLHHAVSNNDWSVLDNDELDAVARGPASAAENTVESSPNLFYVDPKTVKYKPAQKMLGEVNKITDVQSEAYSDLYNKNKLADEKSKRLDPMLDYVEGRLMSGVAPYKPSLPYDESYQKLEKGYDDIQIQERSPLAQAIVSLGPALLGGLVGNESGALAQLPATKRAESGYDQMLKENQILGLKKKEEVSKKMEALSKAKEQDVKMWKDKTELENKNLDDVSKFIMESKKLTDRQKEILLQELGKRLTEGGRVATGSLKDALSTQERIDLENMKAAAEKNKPAKEKSIPAKMAAELGDSINLPSRVESLMSAISEHPEYMGKLASAKTTAAGMVGVETEEATLRMQIESLRQDIGKLKEGGVLRREDELKYQKMLPQQDTNPNVAVKNLKKMKEELEQKVQSHLAGLKAAGYDSSEFESLVDMKKAKQAPSSGKKGGKLKIDINEPEVISGKKEMTREEKIKLLRSRGH